MEARACKKRDNKHTSVQPVFDLTLGSSHGLYNSGSEVDKCPHKRQIHKLLVVQHNWHTSLKVTMMCTV